MLSEAIEEEEEEEEEEWKAPAPARPSQMRFSGQLIDLGSGGEAAPSPSTAEILEEIIDIARTNPSPSRWRRTPPNEEEKEDLPVELDEGQHHRHQRHDVADSSANETTTSTSD